MIAVIQEEAAWRRVMNFVVFLHTGQPNLVDYGCCAFAGNFSDLIKLFFPQAVYHRPIGVFEGCVAVAQCLLRTALLLLIQIYHRQLLH